jgi:bifunctional DNA-binding transcriptional regulator/antitoxin component of YhaV-PrlF toxin-antitoxin module
MKTYSTIVEQDPEDSESYIIQFPDEVLDEAGWKVGDTLVWHVDKENQIVTITKKQNG